MDGESFDLNAIRGLMTEDGERNFTDEEIIQFMNMGVSVDYDIDSAGDAALAEVGSGGLSVLGAPVDMVNSITRGIETVARKGINLGFGTDISTEPEDMFFSSTKPFFGKESIAEGLELHTLL